MFERLFVCVCDPVFVCLLACLLFRMFVRLCGCLFVRFVWSLDSVSLTATLLVRSLFL